jgi:uncharacterized protein YjbJ (UPF0337 family)
MNKELLESQWTQLKGAIKERWGNLTDDEIRQINGQYEQFVAKLMQKYGYSREEAEEELRNWKVDRNLRSTGSKLSTEQPTMRYESDRVRDEGALRKRADEPSVGKWLLFLGIPLLLLAGYFGLRENPRFNEENTSQEIPATTQQATDATISQNIRRALFADNTLSTTARNNMTLDVNNGVVTIRGVVQSRDEKDLIGRTIERVSGVRRVDNQLEVR